MADIVLKDRNGNDIVYPGVTSIKLNTVDGGAQSFNACDEVEKTIDLDFSAGDMEVSADEGTLLSKVTVEKPETLLPENVRNGVEVAGITGEFIGDTEEVTVELALADGDQTVSPSADGKVISGVTITKPANLVPENIAKDVDIAGVTGSLEVPETVETSVALDFSAGDMEVVPESGQAFSKIDIPVPDTLIPENIAEGVAIAGIVGTMAAGGGSGAKVAYGKQRLSLNNVVTHNLGVIPDIVLIWHIENNAVSGNHTAVWIGLSAKFRDAIGISDSSIDQNKRYYKVSTTNYFGWAGVAKPIETTTATAPINNANETTLNVYGSSSGRLNWLAIGGLT